MPTDTYDLSVKLTPDTPIFPGDPVFRSDTVRSIEAGDTYNLCCLHFSNHTGTHIDFPAHIFKGGKTSSDFPMSSLIGAGIILEYDADADGKVSLEFIQRNQSKIAHHRFVFFKTPSKSQFKKPTYVEKKAAEELIRQGVRVVGVDSLTIDPIEAEDLPAHHALLSQDVLIVEGLNLKDIPSGEGEIIIAPLNIPDMDGLPVRVIMRR